MKDGRISLADKQRDWQRAGQLPTPVEALSLVQQVIAALLVDPPFSESLQPQNILFTNENTIQLSTDVPDSTSLMPSSERLGYAAPEQWNGKGVTEQSHIYSSGIILYELLTGHRPRLRHSNWDIFQHHQTLPPEIPLEEARKGLKPETYQLVHTCLRREAWGRYESLAELQTALQQAIMAESQQPTLWQKIPWQNWRWLAPAGVVAMTVFFFIWWPGGATAPETADSTPVSVSVNHSPTPSVTPLPPTATPSPMPTATPFPTHSPTPTSTPTVTLTPPLPVTALPPPLPTATSEVVFLITFDFLDAWEHSVSDAVTLEKSFEQALSLPASGKLSYNFTSLQNEFTVFQQFYDIGGTPTALQIWVYGDGSGHYLNASIQDSEGQTWQVPFGRITHTGWILMTGHLDINQLWPWQSLGGPDNGRVDYPIRFRSLIFDDYPDGNSGQGAIYVDNLTAVYQETTP